MKALVEYFKDKGIIFRKLEKVDLKKLGVKKRMSFFKGVDTKGNYWAIFLIQRKSRILQKDAKDLQALLQSLPFDHAFKKKVLLLQAPICSKAKALLEEEGWLVDAFV